MAWYAALHRVFPLVFLSNSRKTRCGVNRPMLSRRAQVLLL